MANVFGTGGVQATTYQHNPGEFAVVLDWDGDFDLDLELWTADFTYIGDASFFGESPDITSGGQGQEWFVFKNYPGGSLAEEYDLHRDFGRGQYVVSPYFYGPLTDHSAMATLTVFFPDGSTRQVQQTLYHSPPYDQWFALLIDVDAGRMEVLDFFDNGQPLAQDNYQHQPGDFAVVLSWEGDYDLDLEIWSDDIDFLGSAFDLGSSSDITRGGDGEEWFVFREYPETAISREYDLERDFSTGFFVVSPYFAGPVTDEGVVATLTVIFPDGTSDQLQQTLYFTPPYDQWFALLVDAGEHQIEVLDLFAD